MRHEAIHSDDAPQAIGPYSQAVRIGDLLFFSGQIALNPNTMELVGPDIASQTRQVFDNLSAVAAAAGADLQCCVKLNISLTDLGHFSLVNQVMDEYFKAPYPARACVGVAALPMGSLIEIEAIAAAPKG